MNKKNTVNLLCTLILLILHFPLSMCGETRDHEPYEYLSYEEIRENLAKLADTFPSVLQLENSATKLDLPYNVDCGLK